MLKQVLATTFINHEKLLLKIDFHHYKHNIVQYLNFQKIVTYFLVVLMASKDKKISSLPICL